MPDRRLRVLLIDDNVELTENLREVLEEEGHDVAMAPGGAEALRQLEGQSFDVVITDMRMPGMSGLDVLRRIHDRWPALPVIVMTAYAHDSVLEEAQREGALGVLPKPLDLSYLVELIEDLTQPRADVLVVEDDAAARINICEALLGAGVIPHAAPDVATARRLIAVIAFPAAVIDVRLPDGDGCELGRELLEARGDGIRVIYITGYGPELEDTLRSVLSGADVHLLEKPFSPALLLSLIEDVRP